MRYGEQSHAAQYPLPSCKYSAMLYMLKVLDKSSNWGSCCNDGPSIVAKHLSLATVVLIIRDTSAATEPNFLELQD